MDGGPAVVRRVVDANNSCLFAAVGYVMERTRDTTAKLRQAVASIVVDDPIRYSHAFLGKDGEEYANWILNPEHWGGAIELAVLSDFYQREIAAFDVQTKRCDIYGQGKGLLERAYLIYDGIHYDALALTPMPGAPEEFDETIFSKPQWEEVSSLARRVVDEANRMKNFTDTANFTLRCLVCGIGLKGQKEAVEHARRTSHGNFEEYR